MARYNFSKTIVHSGLNKTKQYMEIQDMRLHIKNRYK